MEVKKLGSIEYTLVKTYYTNTPESEAFRFSIGLSQRGYTSSVNNIDDYSFAVIANNGQGVEFHPKSKEPVK